MSWLRPENLERVLALLTQRVRGSIPMIHFALGTRMFGLFKKKQTWETEYAQNIYEGLVLHNDFGDITALSLRIPTAQHHAYQSKILLQREMICFVAIMSVAKPGTALPPVMLALGNLLVKKAADRGLQLNRDQLAETSLRDAELMLTEPYRWGQNWLAEFRNDPNDTYMVAMFADHCIRLFQAYKGGIEAIERKRSR
jgi:hypothetical protein